MNPDYLLKPWQRVLALWIFSCILIVPFTSTVLSTGIENHVLDRFYCMRGSQPHPPELLLVAIDEPSFQELRLPWPWPRSLHARLVKRLSEAGARLIVFDVLFVDPSDAANDAVLAEAIRNAGNVLLAETLDYTDDPVFARTIKLRPLKTFAQSAKATGLAMIKPDKDGVVRHFQTRVEGEETLPAVAVLHAGARKAFPADTSGLIRFAGPARSIDTLSYYQVIDEEHGPPVERIRNRIVLVGRALQASPTPRGQADLFPTPFFSGTGTFTSGVEIQANIIENLLRGIWVRELPPFVRVMMHFPALLFLSLAFVHISPLRGLILLAVSSFGLVGASYWLFAALDLWVPPVLPAGGAALIYTGNTLLRYLQESRKKRFYRNAFSRYVSQSVVEAIANNPKELELGGKEVEATIFFSDLADFTSFSENLPAKDLVGFLNEYFTPMTRIILEHRGGLDKFIGDAIMAFWGVPVSMDEHARLACRAALKMQEAISDLHLGWRARNLPLPAARMGLHSGPVVAGNVGSNERFNYTVMGDTVNLASRLETANKIYETSIIISEDTQRLAGDEFLTRELDWLRVKGRQAPVRIFELIGYRAEKILPFMETFAEGLAEYRSRSWDDAERLFLSISSNDPTSRMYAGRCRLLKKEPPPEDWDGIFVQKTK